MPKCFSKVGRLFFNTLINNILKFNKMKVFSLLNDNNKPFANCKAIEHENFTQLLSYNTIVAEYRKDTNKMIVKGWYSNTTQKHINAFLSFYNIEKMSKKQMIKAAKNN